MFFSSPPQEQFLKAAKKGDVTAVRALLARGVDVDTKDVYNQTALMWAASSGHTEVVRLLMENGAWLNYSDTDGNTALIHAAKDERVESVRLLIDKGADQLKKNRENRTAWYLAPHGGACEAMLAPVYKEHRAQQEEAALLRRQQAEEEASRAVEAWVLMGEERVAFTGKYPKIQRKLTEIFNFTAHERIAITENMETKAETSVRASFDELDEKVVQKAYDAFIRLGGQAEEDKVFKNRIRKYQPLRL